MGIDKLFESKTYYELVDILGFTFLLTAFIATVLIRNKKVKIKNNGKK
ncbi:hypothetical protein [Staphylococcus intermedius]|nr:hypothetical protein [Staphylococcus intermedius]